MVSINVLVASYNQEKVIVRMFDSVIKQKEFGLNQIIIQDDCSKDGTAEVIESYKVLYPGIVVPYYNPHNLGIYGNYDLLRKRCGDADLFIFVAGDDEIGDGLFEKIQVFSEINKPDYSKKIGIYTDWEVIAPNGVHKVFKQDLVSKGYSAYSLFIRHRLFQRGMALTKSLLESYDPVILDRGLNLAEYVFDSQAIRKAEENYYIPTIGSVYYNGIGVSKQLGNTSYYKEDEIVKLNYFLEQYYNTKSDRMWLKACLYRTKYILKPRISSLCLMSLYFVAGLKRYQLCINTVRAFFYPIVRK